MVHNGGPRGGGGEGCLEPGPCGPRSGNISTMDLAMHVSVKA